jgi:flagellar motor protein MotB
MRAQGRRHRGHEEDEESAFVSMTDMTVGFLFVVMILLAFFASQFKNTQTVALDVYDRLQQKYDVVLQDRDHLKVETDRQAVEIEKLKARIAELEKSRIDQLEVYLSRVAQARRQLLERLRDGLKIDFPDLQVQLNEQSDALRFQGDGLFVQGGSTFNAGKSEVVKRIAQRLNEILPCYTLGSPVQSYATCNPDYAVVEAVQIEGHTDSTGTYPFNIKLSADRATTTFGLMIDTVPTLRSYKNLNDQAVISFAGYGPDRPVVSNNTPAGQATNRRIDLRFIMVTPRSSSQLDVIRDRFSNLGVGKP